MSIDLLSDIGIDKVVLNDCTIRLYVNENFSEKELTGIFTVYPTIKRIKKDIVDKELSFFEDIKNLNTREYRVYAVLLALFQRIRLPIEYPFSISISNYIYKISNELPNFELFDRNFDSVYSQFFSLKPVIDTKKEDSKGINENPVYRGQKKDVYENIYRLVLRFWLAGYGLTREAGYEPITTHDLTAYMEDKTLSTGNRKHQAVRFLNNMLIEFESSPINEVIVFSENKKLVDSMETLWNQLELTGKSEIFDELRSFVFNVSLARTKMPYELEYEDIDGNCKTEILSKIELSTWRDKTNGMLDIVRRLIEKEYLTIDNALNGGIQEVVADISHEFQSRLSVSKTVLREWLNYYIKNNKLNFKPNQIIANSLGRGEKRYGHRIHYSAACELIETLLDDQSPYHDDNKISQYRCRRACLLMLESAVRIHEITLLKQNCIKVNRYGEQFLHFHKTKTAKTRTIRLSNEGVKWINQLLEVAPNIKIPISKEIYGYGDSKNEYRLFANFMDNGPLTPSAVGGYLRGLQEKMWKDNPQKTRYFTPHDLRRMCAVYMKMTGHSDEEVKERLGHATISSQIPYLLTKPKSHIEHFATIYERGLWGDEKLIESESDAIYNQTIKMFDNESDTELSRSFIESFAEKFNDIELPSENYLPENEVAGGYPLRSHNCVAKAIVTCHHTEIKCFGCEFYNPDSDKLIHHKAEILRWIIFLNYNTNLQKRSKGKFEKHKIAARVDDVKENLELTFKSLFKKFNMDNKEVKRLEADLYKKAKVYQRKYGKVKPSPTFNDAMDFYEKGVING